MLFKKKFDTLRAEVEFQAAQLDYTNRLFSDHVKALTEKCDDVQERAIEAGIRADDAEQRADEAGAQVARAIDMVSTLNSTVATLQAQIDKLKPTVEIAGNQRVEAMASGNQRSDQVAPAS